MIYHVKITTCSLKNGDFLYARTQFTILRFLGRMALAFMLPRPKSQEIFHHPQHFSFV